MYIDKYARFDLYGRRGGGKITVPGDRLGQGMRLEEMNRLARALRAIAADEADATQVALAWLARNLVHAEGLSVRESCTRLRGLVPGTPNGTRRSENPDRGYCRALSATCLVWAGERVDPTAGATLAHRHNEMPAWTEHAKGTALIGPWMFYRPR